MRSIAIHAPVEDVFTFVDDPKRLPEWVPSLVSVRDLRGADGHRTWTFSYKMLGILFEGRAFVDQHDPPNRLVTKSEGGIDSRWDFELTAKGAETKLRLTIYYAVPGPVLGKLTERLVTRQNADEAELALTRLRDLVEIDVPQRRVRELFAKTS